MRVLHLSMPASLAFFLPEYRGDWEQELAKAEHTFAHHDLNARFWKYVMETGGDDTLFNEIVSATLQNRWSLELVLRIRDHLNGLSSCYGVNLYSGGVRLPPLANRSSAGVARLLEDGWGIELLTPFFYSLDHEFDFSACGLLSLGITSQSSLVLGLSLARFLKARHPSLAVIIGHHNYENYSLLFYPEALGRPFLFHYIAAIILQEEYAAVTITEYANSLRHCSQPEIVNTAWHDGERAFRSDAIIAAKQRSYQATLPPESYFQGTAVPAKLFFYTTSLLHNRCFFAKCTFCVQINKHSEPQAFEEADQVDRGLLLMAKLYHYGIGGVRFEDEAIPTNTMRRFAAGLRKQHNQLPWIGRMIMTTGFDECLIADMSAAGCREILFGLETIHPHLARYLGKANANDTPATVNDLLAKYKRHNIRVILSMIYGSAIETNQDRKQTVEYLRSARSKFNNVAVILNQFVLFKTSAMANDPVRFSLTLHPISPLDDMQSYIHFDPAYTAGDLDQSYDLRYGSHACAAGALAQKHGTATLSLVRHLQYGTIGLYHEDYHNNTLYDRVFLNAGQLY